MKERGREGRGKEIKRDRGRDGGRGGGEREREVLADVYYRLMCRCNSIVGARKNMQLL